MDVFVRRFNGHWKNGLTANSKGFLPEFFSTFSGLQLLIVVPIPDIYQEPFANMFDRHILIKIKLQPFFNFKISVTISSGITTNPESVLTNHLFEYHCVFQDIPVKSLTSCDVTFRVESKYQNH